VTIDSTNTPPLTSSMSPNTTTKEVVQTSPLIHQQLTQRNTPLPTILEVDGPINEENNSPPASHQIRIQPTRKGKL
jgi:hypothetical protein